MTHPIPDEALSQHIAIAGKTIAEHIDLLVARHATGPIWIDDRFHAEPSVILRLFDTRVQQEECGCWTWAGSKRNGAYRAISIHDEPVYAHRVSYALAFGPIAADLFVLHRCDNGSCIRPDHLFLGDQQANVDDMWSKGRAVPPPVMAGVANVNATLSFDRVEEIRQKWAASPTDQRALAAEFGVSQSTVWRLIHKKTRAAA